MGSEEIQKEVTTLTESVRGPTCHARTRASRCGSVDASCAADFVHISEGLDTV